MQTMSTSPSLRASLDFVNQLDDRDKLLLRKWTLSSEPFHNEEQSTGERLIHPIEDEHDKRNLRRIFLHAPRLTSPLHLFRGVYLNNPSDLRLSGSNVMSATADLDVARTFRSGSWWGDNLTTNSCCVLDLTVPVGTPILAVENISVEPKHHEVLLPPAWTLRISQNPTHVIKADYVPSELYAHSRQDVRNGVSRLMMQLNRLVKPTEYDYEACGLDPSLYTCRKL